MQGHAIFQDWLSDPQNQHIAEISWLIKNTEAQLIPELRQIENENYNQNLITLIEENISLYSQLSHYYPPVEIRPANLLEINKDIGAILDQWQQHANQLKQSISSDEKGFHIATILNCLITLVLLIKQSTQMQPSFDDEQSLSLEKLSQWFLSFIDLIRHQQENPSWANDFLQQLSTHAFQELYQMLTHSDTAHLMFHIYYYKLHPDQLSQMSKHPNLLVSIDQRLTFLYQRIEQFIETFIVFSKNIYQLSPQNFLCHGNQLPAGITLRSKDTYKQLIILGLKKLNSKATITVQTPTAELIDAFFRTYQFWFNPTRLLDAIFMLCKRLELTVSQPLDDTLFQHMVSNFQNLETDACINLYGYFSNNDTRYLLRVLHFISHGGVLTQLPPLSQNQQQLISFLYQAYIQIIDALSETLNERHLPCNIIRTVETSKPPSPSKRNLQAILHVVLTYCETSENNTNLDRLFEELEK